MPPARDGHVFVTVGTTEFDALVTVATSESFGCAAIQHGFTRLVVQYGRGKRPSPPQVRSCVLRRSHNTWPAIACTNTSCRILAHRLLALAAGF
jgi:UDP-N-acetylglucosamine transferase subunit ALG13